MLVSEASERFLGHCRSAISLSGHTLRAYGSDLRDVAKCLGEVRLQAVTKDVLRDYIRHLREQRQFKETSIKRRVACMKLLFKWAMRESVITINPFDTLNERIRLPRRLPRALDRHHISQLRRAIEPKAEHDCFDTLCRKTAIQLLLGTGMRVGELASVRIEDLSLADQSIRVHGKGNRQRLVYLLSAPLYRALRRYVGERRRITTSSEKLFVTESGVDLTPQRLRRALHEIAQTAGIDRQLTPHMLRHTCATQWLEAGLDIRYVQKLLGHQSISTTEIYTHVSDQGLREALSRIAGGHMR